jgi:hypothetical protein
VPFAVHPSPVIQSRFRALISETLHIVNVGGFTEGPRSYLDFHRTAVLLKAVR